MSQEQLNALDAAREAMKVAEFKAEFPYLGRPEQWRRPAGDDFTATDDRIEVYRNVTMDGGAFLATLDGDLADLPDLLRYKENAAEMRRRPTPEQLETAVRFALLTYISAGWLSETGAKCVTESIMEAVMGPPVPPEEAPTPAL